MIGASKILTVSYGTFSCTLEGFEEPFNTMKAIAEYFRDLAADDRYFGAEPPTPDAAMLHRIAEREIQRRVEAKVNENGVILRAEDADGHFPAPQPVALPVAPSLAPEVQAVADGSHPAVESVAAKLSRLRAAQSAAPFPTPATEDFPEFAEDSDFSENQLSSDMLAALADLESEETSIARVEPSGFDPESEQHDSTFAAHDTFDADSLGGLIVTDPVCEPEMAANTAPTPQPAAPGPVDFSYDISEDFTPEDTITSSQGLDDLALLDGLGAQFAAQHAPHPAMPDPAMPDAAADLTSDLRYSDDDFAPLAQGTAFGDDALAEDIALAASQSEGVDPDTAALDNAADDALLASLGAMIDPEAESDDESVESVQQITPETTPANNLRPASESTSLDVPDDSAETSEPVAELDAAKPQRARARVIRIRRNDGAIQTPAAEPDAASPSLLSADAEAALQAELAALEAETHSRTPDDDLAAALAAIASPDDESTAQASSALTAPPAAMPEPRKQLSLDDEDAAMSRLIAQANSAMDSADTKRRQSAVAHLKAAVAATEAERMITGMDFAKDTVESAYRSDFDRAVSPRRPSIASDNGKATGGDRGTTSHERLTPLVLVSELRIDRAPVAPAMPKPAIVPVRPRRVTSSIAPEQIVAPQDEQAENMFADSQNFAEFAEALGASELSEMLEAAAVYCAEVLKRPEFSRRHLLNQMRALPEAEDISREDQLRSFGTLLRQGRITRMDSGSYALTERSPFLAEAKRIAG